MRHPADTLPDLKNPSNKPLVSLQDICKVFYQEDLKTPVLHNISLEVNQGDFIALTGSSGSGKSTLLYIIGLLEKASSGSYVINGENVEHLDDTALSVLRSRFVGFVFQSFFLIPYATAIENVLLPGTYSQQSGSYLRSRAEYLLEQVGLSDRMHYTPARLSGGQQQRVALARALLNSPLILLADEPTGQLDSATSDSIMELFSRINDDGTTIVMVTHSSLVASCATRRIEMCDGKIFTLEQNKSGLITGSGGKATHEGDQPLPAAVKV